MGTTGEHVVTEEERDEAEADRVAAEIGRVEAEEDRVDAEAGDGGAALELGRVQAEEGRVEAEAEREEQENRRRIAEGGPDQHVPGNTMLHGRVEAEAVREANLRKWLKRYATIIALTVALIALIPSAVGLVLLKREVNHRCTDAALNRTAVRVTILDGLASLGYIYHDGQIVTEGNPIAYYVEHPDERERALQRTKKALDRFKPIECGTP